MQNKMVDILNIGTMKNKFIIHLIETPWKKIVNFQILISFNIAIQYFVS